MEITSQEGILSLVQRLPVPVYYWEPPGYCLRVILNSNIQVEITQRAEQATMNQKIAWQKANLKHVSLARWR